MFYIEIKGSIPTISKVEHVLNNSGFDFTPVYLHVSVRDFYTNYQQGMIAQPSKEPTSMQQNNLAKELSYIAVMANKKEPKSTTIFGVYNTAAELSSILKKEKTIDQIAENGGFKTFHADDTELTNFEDDFNRYLVKILYQDRLN